MSPPSDEELLVIRPSAARRSGILVLTVIMAALVIPTPSIYFGWAGFLWSTGIGGGALAWTLLSLYRPRIILTSRRIGLRGRIGGVRWVPRSMVALAVQGWLRMPTKAPHNVFLLDADGRRVMRLLDSIFDRTDLEELVAALDVPVAAFPGGTSAKTLARSYPDIVSWPERRPFVVALLIASGLLGSLIVLGLR
ncbi:MULTISPECIES: hypothetical protein [Actinoalloteichus]|uniref:hypothetical protein n=1 Tax=Actinoalloteichus TaxID=65496 RepID=UPI00095108A5|nr:MULTISPECIES: hypothetical protein [Actinoalloteichus]